MHSITLNASATDWRLFMTRKADPAFLSFQRSIFKRDGYACQFCGFRAEHFLEVVNLNGNYFSNAKTNLVTACPFCAQCHFLESVGQGDFGGGSLVYLPEMSQAELNALCHNLFATASMGLGAMSQVKGTYRNLKLRSQLVEKELGEGSSNPSTCGRLLIDARIDDLKGLKIKIREKIRLLPNPERFAREIKAWTLDALATYAP